jgi:Ni,Fe-hydrogenase III small subunit/Pyruvate/2-oxoacid:ferredoxin oxidoreductase delta subunit
MLSILKNRLQQGHRTVSFPGEVKLPERFRGRPVLDGTKCKEGCRECAAACPTSAISVSPLKVDLGACTFCPACQESCQSGAIQFTRDHRLATRKRDDLTVTGDTLELAEALEAKVRKLFGRSLKLRQVSAGGCNACEADLNVLGINVFDLGRFGIQFVASPRHADGLVVTGPVSKNMHRALIETYEATPSPRVVIAVGACAISGGPFAGGAEQLGGIPKEIPVDLFIPGCPPHPFTLLDGFLRLLGRVENGSRRPGT